jgi:nitroreductase
MPTPTSASRSTPPASSGTAAASAGSAEAAHGTGPAKPRTSRAVSAAAAAEEALSRVRPLTRVRQVREFTAVPVTRAELDAITEVARWSGSSRNEQPCRFIALLDRATIGDIAELGLPQTRGLPTASAAVAIVVPDEPEREVSRAFDEGRAAERLLMAAMMLGLHGGISRLRPDVREPIGRRLGLPPHRSVRTIVAVGHPTAEALRPKSKPGEARLPREQVIFEERWPLR